MSAVRRSTITFAAAVANMISMSIVIATIASISIEIFVEAAGPARGQ